MAVREFGRLWKGDITWFYCIGISTLQEDINISGAICL